MADLTKASNAADCAAEPATGSGRGAEFWLRPVGSCEVLADSWMAGEFGITAATGEAVEVGTGLTDLTAVAGAVGRVGGAGE